MKLKVVLTNEDGIPFGLKAEDSVEVIFPYHTGKFSVPVKFTGEVDDFEIELTDFQVNGFKDGENQTFWATLKRGEKIYTFEFLKALTIKSNDGVKAIHLGD